jgi:hypothetical protein
MIVAPFLFGAAVIVSLSVPFPEGASLLYSERPGMVFRRFHAH